MSKDQRLRILRAYCTLTASDTPREDASVGQEPVDMTEVKYLRGAKIETVFRDYIKALQIDYKIKIKKEVTITVLPLELINLDTLEKESP